MLLRRFAWADAEIKRGNYAAFRARMLADNLAGLEGLLVGIVGFGVIGLAVAQAFHRAGCRICYYDPAPPTPQAAQALGAHGTVARRAAARPPTWSRLHVPLLPATHGADRRRASSRA